MKRLSVIIACAAFITVVDPRTALAQLDNPVYVDDSPQAWELFRQARDQQRNNLGEAVRLYQEILDDFTYKLIPTGENAPDQFQSARLRALDAIASNDELLARYRLIQTAPAQTLLAAGDLARLALTRSLTEPGLDALLSLAQRDLEAARFDGAMNWLDQALSHPDLAGRRAAHCRYMRGFVANLRGDAAALDLERSQLTLLGVEGDAFRLALEKLAPDDRPVSKPVITTLDRSRAGQLGDLVAQAIWSVPLEDSLLRRRMAVAAEGELPAATFDSRSRQADLTTAAATVVGSDVFVNEGHTILALNLLTGRTVWTYSDIARLNLLPERDNQEAQDLSMIAVQGDSLVTLTGHAMGTNRGDGGKVICLDATTGSLRWGVTLDDAVDAGPEDEAFPHGAPIIAEGVVYVAVRKVSAQTLTSAYVVALDLNTGSVLWARHITSSAGLQRGSRPFCSLVHDKGSIYMASAVGAAARLDASTGQIRWLHRFGVPISNSPSDQSRRPWEMTGPALTHRGVLVIQPDQRRIALIDNDTGDVLETHNCGTTADWNSPKYLLADADYVYAVGSEVRAFRVDDLEHPVWRLPAPVRAANATSKLSDGPGSNAGAKPPIPQPTPGPANIDIRGRVQVLEDALVVPTTEGVLLVDSTTGRVTNTLAVQTAGNPLAIDSQLLLASGDRIDSYMSFDHAQAMLRQRIVEAPNEPEPALSLLRLAARVGNHTLAMEAADLALAAVNQLSAADPGNRRSRETRAELFGLLLDAAAAKIAASPEQGEQLFAVMANVAIEPEQKVRHLLAYGDWQAERSLTRAVESYQAILSSPVLALSWHVDSDIMRPGAFFAAQRIAAVIAAHGPSAYAPQADFAARKLPMLASAKSPDPAALLALASEFPFAPAAIDASLLAASVLQQKGETRAALGALLGVHRVAPRPETSSRLLAAAVSMCEQAQWMQQARALLGHLESSEPGLSLLTPTGKRTAGEWLAALAPAATPVRGPRVGIAPGTAENLEGGVVPAYDPDHLAFPIDKTLLRAGKSIRLVSADGLKDLWNAPVTLSTELPQLLRFDASGILLWMGSDPQDPKAVMINPATGALAWKASTTPRLADLIADPVRDLVRGRGVRDQMPNGDLFEPQQTIPLVSDRALVMIQRTGGMAAFDLADGTTVLWKRKQSLEQVHFALLSDAALIIAGMVREVNADGANTTGELSPRILLLDPRTGDVMGDAIRPFGRSGVKWMHLTPLGVLVYGTSDGIDAIDITTGQRQFATSSYESLETQRAWMMGNHLIIEDQRSRLHSIDPRLGVISEAFETPLRGEWNPQDLRDCVPLKGATGERFAACYPQRIVVYNSATGTIVGNDVITDDRDYRWLLASSDHFVLVNNKGVSQVAADPGPGLRTQYNYSLYHLSENAKVLSGPFGPPPFADRITLATMMDGWLLLSTTNNTLAIPMKTE